MAWRNSVSLAVSSPADESKCFNRVSSLDTWMAAGDGLRTGATPPIPADTGNTKKDGMRGTRKKENPAIPDPLLLDEIAHGWGIFPRPRIAAQDLIHQVLNFFHVHFGAIQEKRPLDHFFPLFGSQDAFVHERH